MDEAGMLEPTVQASEELRSIVSVLQELTGLTSRWSGHVELVPDAEFKGKKRFTCDIQLAKCAEAFPIYGGDG